MLTKEELLALPPTHPAMVSIRSTYFQITGHYGTENEIKEWYLGAPINDNNETLKDVKSA